LLILIHEKLLMARAPTISSVSHSTRPVLLYDGGCRLCRFSVRAIARLDRDGELDLLPLEDPAASAFVRHLPEDERDATWRLATDSALVGYGRGAVELARALRLTRPAARILGAIPPAALDALYALVSRHRSGLGRLVPNGPAPRRYP
jgi:predicted DCC family thiol-disulfide oxidoreductase YuxK